MVLYPGFLDQARCEHIIKMAKARLRPSSLALRKSDTADKIRRAPPARPLCRAHRPPALCVCLRQARIPSRESVTVMLARQRLQRSARRPRACGRGSAPAGGRCPAGAGMRSRGGAQYPGAAHRDVRTSQGTFISRYDDPAGVLAWVEEKAAQLTSTPVSHGEARLHAFCMIGPCAPHQCSACRHERVPVDSYSLIWRAPHTAGAGTLLTWACARGLLQPTP